MERGVVVKGKAKISFRKVDDSEKIDFIVSGDDIKVITIPVGYTHKIENIGEDDMILCLWCNELLDHNHMDTYPMDV
jgi:UDP-2-acetamido-2,6-beta-L-arabino-hexul-4-ose reductase